MTANIYFLLVVVGLPAAFLLIAIVGTHFHHDGDEQLLDWKPTRSAQRESELHAGDVEQMLDALNRYRRLRGAPERSLGEITHQDWADLEQP